MVPPSLETLESLFPMYALAFLEACFIKARGWGGVSLFLPPLSRRGEKDVAEQWVIG